MLPKLRQQSNNEDRPSSRNSNQSGATTSGSRGSSHTTNQEEVTPIVIDGQDDMISVAFLADGKHIMSRGGETAAKIRRWRVDDGGEVGTCINVESNLGSTATSCDGRWIVGAVGSGSLEVWNTETSEKVKAWNAHSSSVWVIDVSQDGTKIVSGSADKTVCVWSRETGERLVGPLEHDNDVTTVKFSSDDRLIATGTWQRKSVRVYTQDGRLCFDVAIQVDKKNSVAWTGDSRQLFVLSAHGYIHCLDSATGATIAKWSIHRDNGKCIALANNGAFIAAASGSSVSFWDVSTQEQVGSILHFTHHIRSMAISDNLHLAVCGEKKITIRSLYAIDHLQDALKNLKELRTQLAESQNTCHQSENLVQSLRARIVQLEKASQDLHQKSRHDADKQIKIVNSIRADLRAQETSSNAQVQDLLRQLDEANLSLRVQKESSNKEFTHLEQDIQQLRSELAESRRTAEEEKTDLNGIIQSLRSDLELQSAVQNKTIQDLQNQLDASELTAKNENTRLECEANSLKQIICVHEQKHKCEGLYAQGRIFEAVEFVLGMARTISENVKANHMLVGWFTEFPQRCITTLEKIGDEASTAKEPEDAIAAYAAALLLSPLSPNVILMKWVRKMLTSHSAHDVLNAATELKAPRLVVYQAICDNLEGDGRIMEAVECFHQLKNELSDDTTYDKQTEWVHDFRERCIEKLVKLGDTASIAKRHRDAIKYYSDAISLEPADLNGILLKRSSESIELDPSSYKGYEEKRVALNGLCRYGEAFRTFQLMMSRLEHSPDPETQKLRHQYIDVTPLIQKAVQQTTGALPRLVIDAETGRLYDKAQRAIAFEELPIYDELRSSMTNRAQIDVPRIQAEVKKFYRYVMFSHRWELHGEPLLQDVQNSTVYVLEGTSPNIKLQTLCQIVLELGFKWVWSDTCCIDKKDNVVLQESLVAMFSWYRNSALTLVHLRGVWSHSQKPGHLRESVWNSRVWTYQEYLAAKTVQFYTEDWKPYLNLDVFNHKESPAIIEEMESASGIPSQELAVLRPGLDRIREKLSLASTRETSLPEDIAYSLLGIFHASIPVIYGEGDRAVGRLLEHVLSGSGDVSVLAWAGHAGGYNSCLPVDLSVYSDVVPLHIPQPIETSEMDDVVAALHSSLPDLSPAVGLYNHLRKLSPPFMAASRLRLSGIIFPVLDVSTIESDAESEMHIYRVTIDSLGVVEIQTKDDLTNEEDLILIHPWIKPLFDQNSPRRAVGLDDATRALRLVARLCQPFGALLLAPLSDMQYRRVATDALIMARIQEETELTELIDGIDTIDIQ